MIAAPRRRATKPRRFKETGQVRDTEDSHSSTNQCPWKWDFRWDESKPTVGVYDVVHRVTGASFRMLYRQPSSTKMEIYVTPWPKLGEAEVRKSTLEQVGRTTMSWGQAMHRLTEELIEDIMKARISKPVAG